MPPTMKDVAARAGVSVQTVSNVVNGRPIVVEETSQRVQAAMAELGYRPNAIARGLRRNSPQTIALVVISAERRYLVSAPYLDEVVSGVVDIARDSDYYLLLHSIPPHAHPSALTELFHQRRIDGAILTCAELDEPFVDELNHSGIPFVLIERPVSGPKAAAVRADNHGGALQAVGHLVARGYRRLGFISGLLSWASGVDRLAGYRQGLAEAGLSGAEMIARGDWMQAGGYRAMNELLSASTPPDAVFAASDLMAVGALQAARERGLRVPQDVAVIGFDDLNIATMVTPSLTTIRLPAYDLGAKAMEAMLTFLADGAFVAADALLPTELVIRESA